MLAITRFNHNTYRENRDWCEKNGHKGCVYGSPVRVTDRIDPDTILYVLEMNNNINRIVGIGVIVPSKHYIKRAKIYSDNNYNRFVYNSRRRIDLECDYVTISIMKKIVMLEKMLFYGCRHFKRGHGIQLVPTWITLTSANKILPMLQEAFKKAKQCY